MNPGRRYLVSLTAALLAVGCGGAVPLEGDDVYGQVASELRVDVGRAGVAREFAQRDQLPHGIAGDRDLVFLTQPLTGSVVALDRSTGLEVGVVSPPEGGAFLLPFTLRVPETGKLVLLDAGGFPNPFFPAIPVVYDIAYQWDRRTRTLSTQITRTVRFDGLPVVYSEDLEVLADGTYVMSESVIGGLWLITPEGDILPGMVPSGPAPIPAIGTCFLPSFEVGGLPFGPSFGPGVGSLAEKDGWLYFGSSCLGGLHKVPVATLRDQTREGYAKAGDVVTVSPRADGVVETLKGLSFDRWNPASRWLYTGAPFQLELQRIDIDTGEREVVSDDAVLFNFPVAASFLPPRGKGHDGHELFVSSDQEHRLAGINPNLAQTDFELPFRLAKVRVNPAHD